MHWAARPDAVAAHCAIEVKRHMMALPLWL
jgi:hypothetical protein